MLPPEFTSKLKKAKKSKKVETVEQTETVEQVFGGWIKPQIGGVGVQFPDEGPIQIALEDLYPLILPVEEYDNGTLLEVMGSILDELDCRGVDLNDHKEFRESRCRPAVKLIGLSGSAGAGKDTAAAALVEDGWTRLAFADALKAVAYDLDLTVTVKRNKTPYSLQSLVNEFGWDWVKVNCPEARGILQRLGVAVREHVSDSAWVDVVMKKLPLHDRVVITDARFTNELVAIEDNDGVLVLIDRPDPSDLGADAGHVSETVWRDYDFDCTIENTGTVAELGRDIRQIARGK